MKYKNMSYSVKAEKYQLQTKLNRSLESLYFKLNLYI